MRRIALSFQVVARSVVWTLLLAASGCGKSGPKPADADIAAYLAQTQPQYVRIGQIRTAFQAPSSASKLPDGSWRVHVDFVLRAQQDLYTPVPDTRARRSSFDRAVAQFEQFRVKRIAAIEQGGRQLGLVADGASAPEPAVSVRLATRKDEERADSVTLLAEPDGKEWKFFQADAQSLNDETVGAPLDVLRATSPHTVLVTEGSDEERDHRTREARFLDALLKAPKD